MEKKSKDQRCFGRNTVTQPGPDKGARISLRANAACIVAALVALCFLQVNPASANEAPKVLVLHYYHSGFQWTDDINSAISKALQSEYPEGDVFVEYMNTKRVAPEVMSPILRRNYATLYRKAGLNAIIASDNNALDFLLKYGEELFPGVPVVFCGINNFSDYDLRNHRNFTGVKEDFDVGSTLDIALRFHPGTHTIAMIADVGESAQINLAIARNVAKKYGTIRVVELSGLSETALAEKLSQLERGTIILQLSYYRTPEGRVFSVKEGMRLIEKHTQLPVYSLWDFYMIPPAIGGNIVTGKLQGEAAAGIAIRILKGEKPETIPVAESPTAYCFNYAMLKKFDIPESLIPAGSIILGKPKSFYAQYRVYIWGIAILIALQSAAIVILIRNITYRRRAEEALQANAHFLQTLMDAIPSPIFFKDTQGVYQGCNAAFEAYLGLDKSRIVGTSVYDVDPKELADRYNEMDMTLFRQGGLQVYESSVRYADGTLHDVIFNKATYTNADGSLGGLVGVILDITGRKQAEEALRLDEFRLEALLALNQMTDASIQEITDFCLEEGVKLTKSKIGYLAFVNMDETVLSMHAWSRAAMAQCEIKDKPLLYPLETTGLWGEAVRQRKPVITNDYVAPNPLKKGYPEGHVPVTRHLNVPVFDGEHIVAVTGVGNKDEDYDESDVRQLTLLSQGMWRIMQRKWADEELKNYQKHLEELVQLRTDELAQANARLVDSQRYLDKIINSIADPLFVKDRRHNWVLLNDAFCNCTGHPREKLLGKTDYDFFPKSEADVFRSKDELVFSTGAENINEENFTDAEGVVHIIVTKRALYTDEKGEVFIVGIIRDVTERKRIEEELIKAQKLESVGLLAGGIAHDFNNLLTAVLGNISLARTMLSPQEKPYERLMAAERASLMARDLTRRLLTFSRGGAPVKKTVPVAELIRNTAGLALSGSKTTCEFAVPDELWLVDADEGQLSQAINNIVINADQAMPRGGSIKISAENVIISEGDALPLTSGKYIRILVQDQGIGIAEEHLGKIFDLYFTTKESSKGLGLATAYSIIKNHAGHITVESKVGSGTTVGIYLPVAGPSPRSVPAAGKRNASPGKGKILVMDDEAVVREVAGAMLRHDGYEVELAKDGFEAIALYTKALASGSPFDAVIMDLTIPGGMGGKDAMKRLREIDPKVKAIVSSGYSNDPILSNFREYGFAGVVLKPYQVEQLGEQIRTVLMKSNG